MSDSDNCTELQFVEETIFTSDLKEFSVPKRRKHKSRSNSITKRQQDPAMDILCEEKYHIKNALYSACQTGDLPELEKLLNILESRSLAADTRKTDVRNAEDPPNCGRDAATQENPNDTLETQRCYVSKVDFCKEVVTSTAEENGERDEVAVHYPPAGHVDEERKLEAASVRPIRNSNSDSSGSKTNRRKSKSGREGDFSSSSSSSTADILNDVISDGGATLLHVATKEGHQGVVKLLMEYGANPTLRDKRGLTPYMTSNDREMRNVYRRFMAENPDKFDYKSAEIPSPLSEEMIAERLEKKREKQKLKKERLKEKKAAEMQKRSEEEEKRRFLSLSDREKRALAAERRYLGHLSQTGRSGVVLSRCFQCGMDITGKVPFEFDDDRFCTVDCVKARRKSKKS